MNRATTGHKTIRIWQDTAQLLKTLSQKTRRSQIELLYVAVRDLAIKLGWAEEVYGTYEESQKEAP